MGDGYQKAVTPPPASDGAARADNDPLHSTHGGEEITDFVAAWARGMQSRAGNDPVARSPTENAACRESGTTVRR